MTSADFSLDYLANEHTQILKLSLLALLLIGAGVGLMAAAG